MVAFCQSAANLRFSCMVGRRVEHSRTGRKEVISSGEIASGQKTSLTQPKRRPIQREPVPWQLPFRQNHKESMLCFNLSVYTGPHLSKEVIPEQWVYTHFLAQIGINQFGRELRVRLHLTAGLKLFASLKQPGPVMQHDKRRKRRNNTS